MFTHCNMTFKPHEVWFLNDNEKFTHRRFYLATCPKCNKGLAKLVETRISDGETFYELIGGDLLDIYTERLIKEVKYTDQDLIKLKSVPYGFCYGENQEVHNNKGDVIEIRQKRCDFFGNKQLLKKI